MAAQCSLAPSCIWAALAYLQAGPVLSQLTVHQPCHTFSGNTAYLSQAQTYWDAESTPTNTPSIYVSAALQTVSHLLLCVGTMHL